MAPATQPSPRIRHRSALITAVAVLAIASLAACAPSTGGDTPPPSSDASGPASTSPTPTATPTSTATAPATAEPTTPANPVGLGCAATPGTTMPAGAETAGIEDIDGDGQGDLEWMSQTPPFTYGITTASGATFSIPDDLAGPGAHSGWTATLRNGAFATVLDDGRTATLHAVVDCTFDTPIGVNGEPYEFDMQNLRGKGTGVGCQLVDDLPQLGGYQVVVNTDGTRTVTFTEVVLAPDGSSATNGETITLATAAGESDAVVTTAQRSSCLDTPIVATSGQ